MENKKSFTEIVIRLAKKIPKGKVATYSQIAKFAGSAGASRAVGMIMSKNDSPETLPCHRVVSSTGKLTGYAFGGTMRKKELLQKEGVIFFDGTDQVNLRESLWRPKIRN